MQQSTLLLALTLLGSGCSENVTCPTGTYWQRSERVCRASTGRSTDSATADTSVGDVRLDVTLDQAPDPCASCRGVCLERDSGRTCVECVDNGDCSDPAKPACDGNAHVCRTCSATIGCATSESCDTEVFECRSGQTRLCQPCASDRGCESGANCVAFSNENYCVPRARAGACSGPFTVADTLPSLSNPTPTRVCLPPIGTSCTAVVRFRSSTVCVSGPSTCGAGGYCPDARRLCTLLCSDSLFCGTGFTCNVGAGYCAPM